MNSMTFPPAATVLNAIVTQSTGQDAINAITKPQDFAPVAHTALR